jgi:hypothetical protein
MISKREQQKAIRTLEAMLLLFKEKEWAQGVYHLHENRWDATTPIIGHCLIGAWEKCGDGALALLALDQAVAPRYHFKHPVQSPVITYNDKIGRTKSDVLAVIRKAKRLLEAGRVLVKEERR